MTAASRVLEIGVGSGSLLHFLATKGNRVCGCDLSESICLSAKEKFGISVWNCRVADLPQAEMFDVVIMNHVLEHVSDPRAFLKEALSRLTPGGLLHVAVPNVACWEAKLPGWNSYEPYHFVYFTPSTIKRLIAEVPVRILKQETRDSFSGWFLAILWSVVRRGERVSRQARGDKKAPRSVEHVYRVAMIVAGLLTFPVRWLQELLNRGDEIVILGRLEA